MKIACKLDGVQVMSRATRLEVLSTLLQSLQHIQNIRIFVYEIVVYNLLLQVFVTFPAFYLISLASKTSGDSD